MNLFLVSSITCILEFIAPIVIKYIVMRLYCWKQYDEELRNELIKLKQEMNSLSMVDEFAKYAKLRRQYNKVETAFKDKVSERSSSRTKIELSLTYGFQLLNGILVFILLYNYRNSPVIILPEGTLWPLQNFLSWPTLYLDCISLPMWILINKLAISACKS